MSEEEQARLQLCAAAQQLWLRGLVSGYDGLISLELHRRRYLITPPHLRRSALTPDQLRTVDLEGRDLAHNQTLDEAVWRPHRVALHLSASALPQDIARGVARDIRATVLATPPKLQALLALHPGSESIRLHQHPPLVAVWTADDEKTLRLAIGRHALVALPGAGVFAAAATLSDAVSLLEKAEHAAEVELLIRRSR